MEQQAEQRDEKSHEFRPTLLSGHEEEEREPTAMWKQSWLATIIIITIQKILVFSCTGIEFMFMLPLRRLQQMNHYYYVTTFLCHQERK